MIPFSIVPTLCKTTVEAVSDVSEICASCSFTNDSTARGCTVELQNIELTFAFNLFRQSSEELTLLECFAVPEAGVFSVFVYEVENDGRVGQMIWRLPHVFTVDINAKSDGRKMLVKLSQVVMSSNKVFWMTFHYKHAIILVIRSSFLK